MVPEPRFPDWVSALALLFVALTAVFVFIATADWLGGGGTRAIVLAFVPTLVWFYGFGNVLSLMISGEAPTLNSPGDN